MSRKSKRKTQQRKKRQEEARANANTNADTNSSPDPENAEPTAQAPNEVMVLLHQAVQFQQAGQLPEAEKTYNQVLGLDPENVFATQLLGGIALQKGDFQTAADLIGKVLESDPENAELHNNLGHALAKLGRLEEAKDHYGQALALQPDYAQAHHNMGAALRELGSPEEAIAHHVKALEGQPENARARNNYANTLKELKRTDEAIDQYKLALQQDPEYAEAHYNLGVLYEAGEHYEDAIKHYCQALDINPDLAEANFNLGNVMRIIGRPDAAQGHFRNAIGSGPDYAEAHNNLGLVLRNAGDREGAEAHWRQAVEAKPDLADAQVNLALCHFERGELSEGWERYEWRDKAHSYESEYRHFPQPQWDGSPLRDKEIVLWGEQGLGDEILYASIIPDVLKQGAKVTIECTPRLVDLFTRSFAGAEVHVYPYAAAEKGERHYDFQSSFPSLGQHLRSSLDSFATLEDDFIYLKADEEKKAFWQERLADLGPNPKIGLNWSSAVVKEDYRHFYATIRQMAPLLTTPGVDFISLAYGDSDDDIAEALREYGVTIQTWDDLDLKDDIDGVAAMISSLDLVVSCLSAVSELSGALGVKTFGFIGESSHTIMLGTDDVVWFPNTHYYAKERNHPWEPVFDEISSDVRKQFNLGDPSQLTITLD